MGDDTQPPKARTVAVDAVDPLEETSTVREWGIDPEHVERMVPFVDELPPIDVVALANRRFGLLAGYHRVEAHRLAGKARIKVIEHDIPVEQWFAFAVRSNTSHGSPLSLAERKAAAQRMLADGDRRSDRAIAADCGLDHKTVGVIRRDGSEPSGENPQLRVGLDGRARRVPVADDQEFSATIEAARQLTDRAREAMAALIEVVSEEAPWLLDPNSTQPIEPDAVAPLADLRDVLVQGIEDDIWPPPDELTTMIAAIDRAIANRPGDSEPPGP